MAGYSVTYTVVDQATKQIDQINRRIAAMRAPIDRAQRSMSRFIDVSGLRKIADGFNWIARAASGVLRSLTAIVPVLGAITSAATIAGMVKLVSSFAAWGNQLRTNADQIGITTDQLQLFQDATTRAGGNAQDMTETLKNLHKISADAFTGMNADAAAYFRRFNISLTDANGQLRTATDLLPEVFKALDSLQDPADRSRVAAALLGDAQAKLYEEYKQSGKPLEEWLRLEEKHQRATKEQLDSLNDYRLSVASLETSFDQLGRQVSATLAKDLAPLVKALDEWVQKHSPEIIKAVDDITKGFESWLKDVNWDQVKGDIDGILKLLRIMLDVAEAIGKAIEKTMFLFGLTNRQFTKEDVLKNSPWYAQLTDEQKRMVRQQVGISDEDYGKAQQPQPGVTFGSDPLGWLKNRVLRGGQGNEGYTAPSGRGAGQMLGERALRGPESIQPPGAPAAYNAPSSSSEFMAQQQRLIFDAATKAGLAHPDVVAQVGAAQAGVESGYGQHHVGGYNIYGIKANADQLARGQYAEAQTREVIGGQNVMMPQKFAAYNSPAEAAAAYVELMKTRKAFAGVTSAATTNEAVAGLTHYATDPNYQAVVGGVVQSNAGRFASNIAQAPPVAPPAAPPSVNGSVTVDINHRNAPADTTVAASGNGAVNVNPPRTVMPQLDFAAA